MLVNPNIVGQVPVIPEIMPMSPAVNQVVNPNNLGTIQLNVVHDGSSGENLAPNSQDNNDLMGNDPEMSNEGEGSAMISMEQPNMNMDVSSSNDQMCAQNPDNCKWENYSLINKN